MRVQTFSVILLAGSAEFVSAQRKNETLSSGLIWNDLSVQTSSGTYLVHNCHGFVPNGNICGILGPSGAGKVRKLGLPPCDRANSTRHLQE